MSNEKKKITKKEIKEFKENVKKRIDELSDDELDRIAGGAEEVDKDRIIMAVYMCEYHFKWKYVDPPKYPCPICGSKNVLNYDPGQFSLMRVICLDCGEFRSRTGYAACPQPDITFYD